MQTLPYFLFLLQKNLLLCSIITQGSFTHINLNQVEHVTRSENFVSLVNFQLDESNIFSSVDVMFVENDISITFHTTNPDYYNHPEYYFQRPGTERYSNPYQIFGLEAKTRKKRLGNFELFEPNIPLASVSVVHSSLYGYVVNVDFYTFNLAAPAKE